MELKTYFAQDAAGNIISSAIVNVFLQGTTTLATGLTRADGTPLENPFAADGAGRIQFRAPDGYYDIQVSAGSGIIQTLTIQCVDYSEAKSSAEQAQNSLNSITGINTNFEQNSREQWRRSLAEAGLTLVDGSFEEGATVNSKTDAVWYIAGGRCYTWDAGGAKTVPTKSTPSSTGGVGLGAWVDKSGSATAFIQEGTGAVPRTAQDKMREEYPSIADYGAVGDGTDDTAAFILAQNAHPFIEVPAGFTCKVQAGLQYWKFFGRGSVSEPGRTWSLTAHPQTTQQNKHYVETFGTYEGAAGQSISINSGLGQEKGNTPILGTDSQGLAQVYSGRDHVGQIIYAKGFIPDVLDATTAYTLNTLGNVAVSGLYASGKIKPGMIIDTQHTNPCTGIIKSVGGNTIEVDAWWPKVGASPITPANGVGAIINPNNKIFGQNVVVQTTGNGGTTGAKNSVGIEVNIITPASATPISGTYGYDLSVLNGGYLDVGYQIYGKRNISFYSNNATGGGGYGFRSVGDIRGLSVEDAITSPIDVIQAGVSKFSVSPLGLISSAAGVDLSAVKFRSIGPNKVDINPVNVGTEPANGSFIWITGFNISGGAEASFVLVVRDGVIDTILSSDGSGLGITFSVVRRQLKIKTTSGVYQFTGMQFLT